MNTRVLFCQETKILTVPTLSNLVTAGTLNFLRGRAYTLKAWSYFQEGAVLRPQILILKYSVTSLHSDSGRRLSLALQAGPLSSSFYLARVRPRCPPKLRPQRPPSVGQCMSSSPALLTPQISSLWVLGAQASTCFCRCIHLHAFQSRRKCS